MYIFLQVSTSKIKLKKPIKFFNVFIYIGLFTYYKLVYKITTLINRGQFSRISKLFRIIEVSKIYIIFLASVYKVV